MSMQKQIFNLQKLIQLRRYIHQNPQIGFKQFNTSKTIINTLLELGISKQNIQIVAQTGIIVNIAGKAVPQGNNRMIAFRADMDALTMQQNNNLSYKSINNNIAHMCGHDGHIVCLIGFIMKFLPKLHQIPSNKTMRLIFQPSEEGPKSGALQIINEGGLQGVDQIYGMHNFPSFQKGTIFVKSGPIMSESSAIRIYIYGTSGHGSAPQKVLDCIPAGIKFYQIYVNYVKQLQANGHNFVSTLPIFQAGQRVNVFSERCFIGGGIRSFQQGLSFKIITRIKQILKQLQNQGYKTEFTSNYFAPINMNTPLEANHVARIAKKILGQQHLLQNIDPLRASQDFAYYTRVKPGAFFIFGSKPKNKNNLQLHCDTFDFNDEIIQAASNIWLQLALDRLEINL